jgi:hypothetical protein
MNRIASVSALALFASPAAADFATDFGIAWDGIDSLAVEFNFDSVEPISNFIENGGTNGDFTGFFSDEPGFANFFEDEADEGLFIVPDGTVVAFRLLGTDAAFNVFDPFFDAQLAAGDTFELGAVTRDGSGAVTAGFDDHPWWTIDTTSADFDANIFDYDVTFELFDARTDGLAISSTGPITVTFSRIPAPGSGALLAIAGLAAARRRR